MQASLETQHAVNSIVQKMEPFLNEKQNRILLGIAAEALGRGGISYISEISGASRTTVRNGLSDSKELPIAPDAQDTAEATTSTEDEKQVATDYGFTQSGSPRIRREGGGRKKLIDREPELVKDIEQIIQDSTYGNPENCLSYTTLSLRAISDILEKDFNIVASRNIVSRVLDELHYSKQQNQKAKQVGKEHPDREEQFQYINKKSKEFIEAGDPVISVDTKKKENVGNFKNPGSEYRKSKDPRLVLDHDFPLPELGKVNPYGVYVVNNNTAFVNLGTDHDTSEFAAESICRWWFTVGKPTFPEARRIYITADGGGSNRARGYLWKYELQQIANVTGLEIHMSHFPPGTSKWNKVEHRLFCYISKNWQGKPLIDIETIISLIGSTTTKKGLKVLCALDSNKYPTQIKLTDEQKESIQLEKDDILGQWNYVIKPEIQEIG